jgi:hypothetical protein
MDEFIVKKIAEVQAFSNLSVDIINKSSGSFGDVAPDTKTGLLSLKFNLSEIVKDQEFIPIYEAKVSSTHKKLSVMMELYIGDSWDNPVEVLEWLSFYSGAASAHANLVSSCMDKIGLDEEHKHLSEIDNIFWKLLSDVKRELANTGIKRVSK